MSVISNSTILRSLGGGVRYLRLVRGHTDCERALASKVGLAAEALWTRHDQFQERGAFLKGASCVCGFADDDAAMIRTMLRKLGLGPCASCVKIEQMQDLGLLHNVFRYLIVNFDAFEDSDAAVTALLAFRQLRIDVVVILVSSEVAKDDLGAERAMICDATLRAPVTPARLQRGLSAAFENNAAIRCDRETQGFERPFCAVLAPPITPHG